MNFGTTNPPPLLTSGLTSATETPAGVLAGQDVLLADCGAEYRWRDDGTRVELHDGTNHSAAPGNCRQSHAGGGRRGRRDKYHTELDGVRSDEL